MNDCGKGRDKMLKKTGKIWSSFSVVTFWKRSRKPKPSGTASSGSKPSRLIRTIHEATLEQFIRCLVDRDYGCLVLEGKPPESELLDAWRDLYEGYMDAMKDTKRQYVMKVAQQVNVLLTKFNLVSLIITRLELEYSAEMFEELRRLIPLPKNLRWDTPENKRRSLDRLATLRGNINRQLLDKQTEYQRIAPMKADGGKLDRGMFTDLIVAVSKHMQFRIDRLTIPLSDFVGMVVDMREKYEAERRKALKTKHGR